MAPPPAPPPSTGEGRPELPAPNPRRRVSRLKAIQVRFQPPALFDAVSTDGLLFQSGWQTECRKESRANRANKVGHSSDCLALKREYLDGTRMPCGVFWTAAVQGKGRLPIRSRGHEARSAASGERTRTTL